MSKFSTPQWESTNLGDDMCNKLFKSNNKTNTNKKNKKSEFQNGKIKKRPVKRKLNQEISKKLQSNINSAKNLINETKAKYVEKQKHLNHNQNETIINKKLAKRQRQKLKKKLYQNLKDKTGCLPNPKLVKLNVISKLQMNKKEDTRNLLSNSAVTPEVSKDHIKKPEKKKWTNKKLQNLRGDLSKKIENLIETDQQSIKRKNKLKKTEHDQLKNKNSTKEVMIENKSVTNHDNLAKTPNDNIKINKKLKRLKNKCRDTKVKATECIKQNFKKANIVNNNKLKVLHTSKQIKTATTESEYEDDDILINPSPNSNRKIRKKLSLRDRMLGVLKASRFRYLNEQIYTADGKYSQEMFTKDPEAYEAYHEGYRQQVSRWPVNPVDIIINSIKKMPKNYIVADFGCGDAKVAQEVEQKVHSFDLVAANEHVTACDMANVPLKKGSVDVVVFCLSLMGVNLQDFLKEANRVLKIGGIMKIAEVESRFDDVENFIKGVQHFGFQNMFKDLSHNIFYFMDFRKNTNIKKSRILPTISLHPCLYKKRQIRR